MNASRRIYWCAMRGSGPTPEEQVAFKIVERELGVSLDLSRELEAPNQVDAVLMTPEGASFAALEATTLCDKQAAESGRLLSRDKHRWHFPGLRWWWSVEMPVSVRLKEAKQQLPVALRLFEEHGISRPAPSPFGPPPTVPAIKWYVDNRISAHGFTSVATDGSSRVREPGSVIVTPPGVGGFSGSVDEIPAWISGELKSSTLLQSKLAKLQRSGFDEQHLFLFVDMSGAPFSVYNNLASEPAVPTAVPELETITHLWLFPMPSFGSFLTWERAGWRRRVTPPTIE